MSEADPAIRTGLQLSASVSVDGAVLGTASIVSIETWSSANRIPRARIAIYDGKPSTRDFPLSDSGKLVPGAKVTVSAGYGSGSDVIHTGVIIRHSIKIVPGQSPQLIVETADPLLKMTIARNSAVSQQTSDSDLISTLVSAGGGSVGKNGAGTDPAEAVVQYYASDWDLMLLRAEASGCVVTVEDSTVDVIDPAAGGSPVLKAEYGNSIIAFEGTVDAADELETSAVASRSWSYAEQAVKEDSGSASGTPPGNFSSSKLAEVLGVSSVPQQSGATVAEAQLKRWSAARLMRSRLAQVQGSARFQGSAAVKPGSTIELAGVGDRFNGNAFVSAVRHAIRDGRWVTTAQFGMAPEAFSSQRTDVAAPPASGLAPPMRGLHTGQVKQVATDPNGDFRVLVTMPLASAQTGVWARLGQFYASNGFGALFFPEVGDEVVLGFMDEDPASPVILASLYSRGRAPQTPPDEANNLKAIVTRKKLEIDFDDDKTILTVKTPGGRKITLDDTGKTLKIEDPFSNSITMGEQDVTILSGKSMTIKSGTDLTIQSGTSMTQTAGGDYTLTGNQVSATGKLGLSLVSNTNATLKGSIELAVSAPIVKIN